ncbi:MAG: hypothetical protein Q8L05_00135 [Actinomycetota bacterium]|nr:hypothetical protein [Actinomycetota bacterium]MDP2287916.1 hypothetical protein [Actinomycetota bacterium]
MRKHPTDFVSLIFGLITIGTAISVLIYRYTDVDLDLRFAIPLAFVTLGVLGLLGSVVAQRRSNRRALAEQPGAEVSS